MFFLTSNISVIFIYFFTNATKTYASKINNDKIQQFDWGKDHQIEKNSESEHNRGNDWDMLNRVGGRENDEEMKQAINAPETQTNDDKISAITLIDFLLRAFSVNVFSSPFSLSTSSVERRARIFGSIRNPKKRMEYE